ncbi:Aspartokinase [Podochytrium sp. JEL0797]|nr:Aspartokinase [Podochytrium sp. JEL0797]
MKPIAALLAILSASAVVAAQTAVLGPTMLNMFDEGNDDGQIPFAVIQAAPQAPPPMAPPAASPSVMAQQTMQSSVSPVMQVMVTSAPAAWSVLRIDGQSLGTNAGIAQIAQLVRLIEASSHCLQTKLTRRGSGSLRASCPHIHLVSSLERDLVQLIRRSVRDPILGEDAEAYVGESLRGVREFLSAIEIVGEMSPTSYDALISAGDNMAAFVLTCALQSQGLPAKLIQTDNLIDPSFAAESLDDAAFSHIVSNLTRKIEESVLDDCRESIIPVFSGAFGTLPSPLSLHTHLPSKQHTSVFASLVTLALSKLSNSAPNLFLLHTHMRGIHSIDPRVVATATGPIRTLSLSAAVEICGVGENGGILSSTGLELALASAGNVCLSKISDVLTSLQSTSTMDFETAVKQVGTRISSDTESPNSTSSDTIVIYRKGVTVVRIDRLLDSSDSDGAAESAVALLRESHKILGFVFQIMDEFNIRVCSSSSSYKTVTVAVAANPTSSTLTKAIARLQGLKALVSVYPNKGLISLISTTSKRVGGGVDLIRKLLCALSGPKIHIEMCSQGVGAIGVSVVVNENEVEKGVRAVHEAVC